MQDGDEYLAGTAKRVVAHLSPATAAALGVAENELVTVATERGAITAPAAIVAMPDDVVWLPTYARASAVRSTLAAGPGSVVTVAKAAADATAGQESFPYVIEVPVLDDDTVLDEREAGQ
jgi:NADH-quinone oxidoreductase subunit G